MIYRVELQYINAQLKYLPSEHPEQDSIGTREKEQRRLELRADIATLIKQKSFVKIQLERLVRAYERIVREIAATEKEIGPLEAQNNEHACFVKM